MADFPTFDDVYACDARVLELMGNMPMSVANTNLDSYLTGVRLNNGIVNRMRSPALEPSQKASIAAAWIGEHLVFAAPRKIGLWLINKKTITTLKREIMMPYYAQIAAASIARFGGAETIPEDLLLYRTVSRQFRLNIANELTYFGFNDMGDVINPNLPVSRELLVSLNNMLTSIVNKRQLVFGGNAGQGPVDGGGAQHYDMYIDYILDPTEDHALMSLYKRTKGNNGTPLPNGELAERAADGSIKNGYLLLSTALKTYIRAHPDHDFAADPRPMMIHALAEANQMRDDVQGQIPNEDQNYSQQCANLDIIFNFYLTCRTTGIFTAGGDLSAIEWRNMKKLNQALYAIGQRLLGKRKVLEIITAAGGPIRTLMTRVNNTGSIHMPPYACTMRRIYDFVAVFGMIKYNEIERTFFSCGLSPRYFVHFDVKSPVAMQIITFYWTCLEAMNEGTNEIKNEAEHYFHQLLINKISGYTNTTGKRGDVFAVRLVEAPGNHIGGVAQPTIAQLIAQAGRAQDDDAALALGDNI